MNDKMHTRPHRPRSRERFGTFHVLEHLHHAVHSEVNKRMEPGAHKPPNRHQPGSGRRDAPAAARSNNANKQGGAAVAGKKQRDLGGGYTTRSRPPQQQQFHYTFQNDDHNHVDVGSLSHHSIGSTSRAPACSFTHNFQHRGKSYSPKRNPPASGRKFDDDFGDEPTDIVVWDANKKKSRANILCPLTDSEFNNVHVNSARGRSSSAPSGKQRAIQLGLSRSLIYSNLEDACQTGELLDDFLPPSPHEATSSVSTASSYDYRISLITDQLDQIEQAQNDILNQLGDEIAQVTIENDRLQQEIEDVRNQNAKLHQVIWDMSGYIEKIKQSYKNNGLPVPESLSRLSIPPGISNRPNEGNQQKSGGAKPSKNVNAEDKCTLKSSAKFPSKELVTKDEEPLKRQEGRRTRSRDRGINSKSDRDVISVGKNPPELNSKSRAGARQEKTGCGESVCELDPEKTKAYDEDKMFRDDDEDTSYDPSSTMFTSIDDPYSKDESDAMSTKTRAIQRNSRTYHVQDDEKRAPRSRDRKASTSAGAPPGATRHSSRERLRKNNNNKDESIRSQTVTSTSTKTTKSRKRSGGGCFGLFNLFWPKPYSKDSDDEVLE